MDVFSKYPSQTRLRLTQLYTNVIQAFLVLLFVAVVLCGCNSDGDGSKGVALPNASIDWSRDILQTSVRIDFETMTGSADVVLSGSLSSTGASFEVGDLLITNVTSNAAELDFISELGRLDVGVPASAEEQTLSIDYSFSIQAELNGILDSGVTFTWPYYCGNIFPCKSMPAEGSSYELMLSGISDEMLSIYPESIPTDAPAYMLAWAVGDYEYSLLGVTSYGTEVGVYYLPDQEESALAGTQYLTDVFDWYEQTYGEYGFGGKVASVSVDWFAGGYGGMEHHPFWHIEDDSLSDPVVHAHEAVHGWFGNGVRIACWEDFVLSEGVASYLTARAMSEVAGADFGSQVWSEYENRLDRLQSSDANKIAWPEGCNEIDILEGGLFGIAPYMKGAFFFRHLEHVLGVQSLDRILADFYAANRGEAATMQDLLDLIAESSEYDPSACAAAWLRNETLPDAGYCAYQ
ncbi:MAG: M1 family aminopeptidase [Candidatus Thiodiazotropha sp.]